jgi:hypothetical protein
MGQTTFSGPVRSLGGFVSGSSAAPVAITTAANASSSYGTSSAVNGDSRLNYQRLTFTAAGSGETLRAWTVIASGAGAVAPAGTVNGAHISLDVNGTSTVSGAGNALRATIGGTSTNPGGTLSAIQADSNFATGGTWTNAAFLRFTNSGTGTITNLMNVPAAMVQSKSAGTHTKSIAIVDSVGTTHYLMCADAL